MKQKVLPIGVKQTLEEDDDQGLNQRYACKDLIEYIEEIDP